MKVTVARPGLVQEVDLLEGTTVGELLYRLQIYDDGDSMGVRLNGQQTFPNNVLGDGDQVFIALPIRGAAPLPPGRVPEGIRQLRQFTVGATKLLIIDPYIVTPRRGSSIADYVRLFSDCVDLASRNLKDIRILFSWWHPNQDVLDSLAAACAKCGCGFTHGESNDVHDRIWIRDSARAILVGTSLNAVGGRLAFVLELPKEDLAYLMDFLQRRGLLSQA